MEYFKGVVVKDLEIKWADIQPGNSGDVLVLGNDGSRWTKLEPNSYPQAKESFSKAVWVPIKGQTIDMKREPIRSDRDWQSLPCCGGLYTRGICNMHNCPPEEK